MQRHGMARKTCALQDAIADSSYLSTAKPVRYEARYVAIDALLADIAPPVCGRLSMRGTL